MADKKNTPKKVKTGSVSFKVTPADFQKLNTWNKVVAALFAVQAVLLVAFSKAMTIPVVGGYSAEDPLGSDAAGHTVYAPALRHLFDVRVAWVLAAGLLIFALGHLLMATAYRKRYELDLKQGLNRWRWATLGLGGGVLVTVVAMLSGVQYLALLVAILLLTGLAAALVLVNERLQLANKGQTHQLNHMLCTLATAAAVFPWVVLAAGAVGSLVFDGKLPMYMYGVYASGVVLVVAIAVATANRAKRQGKWADDLYVERVYMLLGLAAASLVVWQVFVGALT